MGIAAVATAVTSEFINVKGHSSVRGHGRYGDKRQGFGTNGLAFGDGGTLGLFGDPLLRSYRRRQASSAGRRHGPAVGNRRQGGSPQQDKRYRSRMGLGQPFVEGIYNFYGDGISGGQGNGDVFGRGGRFGNDGFFDSGVGRIGRRLF